MAKPEKLVTHKQLTLALKPMATKAFVEKKIDGLAQSVERAFQKMATKEDLKQLEKKIDGKFATKKDFEGMEQRITANIIRAIEGAWEKERADLQELHQDELDIVAGKRQAPASWKSIPRRLTIVEQGLEHVKDKLRSRPDR